MQPQNTDSAAQAVLDTCSETLASIKAVKGEDFAELVKAGINVKSLLNMQTGLATHLSNRLGPGDEASRMMNVLCLVSAGLMGQFLDLLQDKAGGEAAFKEAVDWVERIHENAHRVGKAVLEMPLNPPPPLQ